jgi:hypothetical protein
MAHHDPGHQVASTRWLVPSVACVAAVSAAGLVLAAGISGSIGRVLIFVLALAVFVAPGVFLAGRWFAGLERHAAGVAIGYFLSSLVASFLYRVGMLTPVKLGVASLVLALAAAFAIGHPKVTFQRNTRAARLWLAATLALATGVVALPFLRVGEETAEGVAYRAYFSADLMTHLSVVAELQKGDFPPENPFYAGRPLGYQWLFFAFPALVGRWIGNQPALLLTNLVSSLLFAALAFAAACRMAVRPRGAFAAVAIGLVAASYEGMAALLRSLWLGESLGAFRNMNLDAFSRWFFELTSLDGLHRSLLYTPQHLYSYSLLLILVLLVYRFEPRGVASSILAGGILGGMAGTSIVTAMIAGPWLVMGRIMEGGQKSSMFRDLFIMAATALACLGWYFELGFFGEAGGALVPRLPRLAEMPALLLLEAGPLFLLALPALGERHARPIASLAAMALMAILFMDIGSYPGVWMAWRAGSILLVALMLMVAVTIGNRRPWTLAVVLLPAVLTFGLDIYNAQDVTNRDFSRGTFRWTTVVDRSDYQTLGWIRSKTPPEAIVQWDTRAREPGEWALIPALAERRMAVGFPIFLLDNQKYRRRERRLRPIFVSPDVREAHRLAVEAGIDYLIIGSREVAVRGDRVRKLWEAPRLFRVAYSNDAATVFEVIPS